MRRLLTLLVVVMLTLGAGGGVLAQDDGPSPDSPTKDRDDDAVTDDEGEQDESDSDDEGATPESDTPVDDEPNEDEPLPEAPDGPLDLAAMTLDSEEIPEGFQLVAETYIDLDILAENLSELVTADELEDLGIVGYYETTYVAVDGGSQIRSYVIEYPDANAVEDGFALLEDEERMVPGETDLEDAPGPEGIGEEPSEVTTGTYGEPGAEQSSVDITFRIDRLGVGVAMETFDGSEPDEDLIEELAEVKEARVVAALTGEEIENVDPRLVERVVTFEGETTFEGYQSVSDAYGSVDSPAADGFIASYVRGATFSDDPTETIAPYVTVGVSSYEDEDAVLAVLDASDQIIPQFPELEEIDTPLIEGSATVGYSFESLIEGGDLASVRLLVAVDDELLSVDVQGFASADDALEAAVAVAEAEVACVGGGDCGPVGLPDGLGGDEDDGTPVVSPDEDVDEQDEETS